jgi:hypothetical protein
LLRFSSLIMGCGSGVGLFMLRPIVPSEKRVVSPMILSGWDYMVKPFQVNYTASYLCRLQCQPTGIGGILGAAKLIVVAWCVSKVHQTTND